MPRLAPHHISQHVKCRLLRTLDHLQSLLHNYITIHGRPNAPAQPEYRSQYPSDSDSKFRQLNSGALEQRTPHGCCAPVVRMVSPTSPIAISSSPILSPSLAQHVQLGFDAEDLTALFDSIEASQNARTPGVPHIPAEILLNIVEHIPFDEVLKFRLVSKGFRDYIDTHLLYSYIQRTELFFFPGLGNIRLPEGLEETVRAKFSHLRQPVGRSISCGLKPKWGDQLAVYHIDPIWWQSFQKIREIEQASDPTEVGASASSTLSRRLDRSNESKGTSMYMRWAMRLDHGVLDLVTTAPITTDLDKGTITIEWRESLLILLRTESTLRTTMKKTEDRKFTYSHAEDCLRQVRRENWLKRLDPNKPLENHLRWVVRTLSPLFGKVMRAEIDPELGLGGVQHSENLAIDRLQLLRREASLSKRERKLLENLAQGRVEMICDLEKMSTNLASIKAIIFADEERDVVNSDAFRYPVLPSNVLAWEHDTVAREVKRLEKWKSVKGTLTKINFLLDEVNETLLLPEDAFDSEI